MSRILNQNMFTDKTSENFELELRIFFPGLENRAYPTFHTATDHFMSRCLYFFFQCSENNLYLNKSKTENYEFLRQTSFTDFLEFCLEKFVSLERVLVQVEHKIWF